MKEQLKDILLNTLNLENILFNLEYCRTGLDKGAAQGYIAEHTKFGELVATPESKVNL